MTMKRRFSQISGIFLEVIGPNTEPMAMPIKQIATPVSTNGPPGLVPA